MTNNKKQTKSSILIRIFICAALAFATETISYTGIVWLAMFILGHIDWITYNWDLINYFACGFVLALINSVSYIIGECIYFIKLRKLMQRYENVTKDNL